MSNANKRTYDKLKAAERSVIHLESTLAEYKVKLKALKALIISCIVLIVISGVSLFW